MRSLGLISLLPLVQGARIIQSNDDGWAEANARTFFNTLTASGHNVVLSAPAENQSGRGSLDSPPTTVDGDGCQFSSCPPNAPPTGFNQSNPRLNYVNSYPVTAIKTGIDTTASKFFGNAKPELAVAGPNVGSNLGVQVYFSGTVGAATYAAQTAKIPAIAFSGKTGDPTAWNQPTPLHARVYADLANNITSKILASGAPYLPDGVYLNVNFPEVTSTTCNNANSFKFILSRIFWNPLAAPDVETCGGTRLPDETDVVNRDGCYVSISVGNAEDKTTLNDAAKQGVVLQKLQGLVSCLP